MLKTTIAACLLLATGCAASDSTSTASSNAAATATATLSLKDAQAQIAAVRAKFEPTGAHELIFNPSLAPAYLAAVKPIFAATAPSDKLELAGDAFTYVSYDVQAGVLVGGGMIDDAIAASYEDLWDFTFLFGVGLNTRAGFWPTMSGLVARSKAGALNDLQVVELVSTSKAQDFAGGLGALDWNYAPQATDTKALIVPEETFNAVLNFVFGDVAVVPSGTTHDIAADDEFGAQVFTQTFSKVRLLNASDEGVVIYDLGSHLREAQEDTHLEAAHGLSLAKAALTATELTDLQRQL
jgi:hypothetical protein